MLKPFCSRLTLEIYSVNTESAVSFFFSISIKLRILAFLHFFIPENVMSYIFSLRDFRIKRKKNLYHESFQFSNTSIMPVSLSLLVVYFALCTRDIHFDRCLFCTATKCIASAIDPHEDSQHFSHNSALSLFHFRRAASVSSVMVKK